MPSLGKRARVSMPMYSVHGQKATTQRYCLPSFIKIFSFSPNRGDSTTNLLAVWFAANAPLINVCAYIRSAPACCGCLADAHTYIIGRLTCPSANGISRSPIRGATMCYCVAFAPLRSGLWLGHVQYVCKSAIRQGPHWTGISDHVPRCVGLSVGLASERQVEHILH